MTPPLTPDERRAVADLRKLAARWPKTLMLFSWSGDLCVLKPARERTMGQAKVTSINGIPNGGGDPNMDHQST